MSAPDTNTIGDWKDVTSYSRDDTERKPETYQISHGDLRIVITCGHIYHRPDWVMHCRQLGIDTKALKAKTTQDAKAEAVRIVGATIKVLHSSYEKIYETML